MDAIDQENMDETMLNADIKIQDLNQNLYTQRLPPIHLAVPKCIKTL